MTPTDVAGEASSFGWEIADKDVREAVGFLQKLGLVKAK